MTVNDVFASAVILVVDDNRNNLSLAQELLEKAGYRVRVALNGEAALDSARDAPPDLILLDIHMPVLDGYETCRALKDDELLDRIPVIFLSGLDEGFNKVEAFKAGGADYVTKPFEREELLARVAVHLSLARSRKALEEQSRLLQAHITELEQNRRELSEKQEQVARARMSADLAHELNNPVNYIVVGTAALEQDFSKWLAAINADEARASEARSRYEQEIFELLRGVREGAERAARIVEALKELRIDIPIDSCGDDFSGIRPGEGI